MPSAANAPGSVDPGLFAITARVKKAEDVDYVRDRILGDREGVPGEAGGRRAAGRACASACATSWRCSMDNSDTIAQHSLVLRGAASERRRR